MLLCVDIKVINLKKEVRVRKHTLTYTHTIKWRLIDVLGLNLDIDGNIAHFVEEEKQFFVLQNVLYYFPCLNLHQEHR